MKSVKIFSNNGVRRWLSFYLLMWVTQLYASPAMVPLYIGTFTSRGSQTSEGIYVAEFDPTLGKVSRVRLAARAQDSAFLALDPVRRRLFAVSAVPEYAGRPGGAVSSYAIDDDGTLKLLNQQASEGAFPVHVVLTPEKTHIIVSNFRGANLSVLPVNPDGSLGPSVQNVALSGHSIHPLRQKEPHPHAVNFSPDGRLAVATLLGSDECRLYRFSASTARLEPATQSMEKAPPGAGPRHFAYHPLLPVAYSINELYSTVSVYSVETVAGTMRHRQQVGTLPALFTAGNTSAEVVVHPSGRFVYASNRGHDSIAVFSVDALCGDLTLTGIVPTGGRLPRSFICDPSGRWLLVANQDSDNLAIFAIDSESGGLAAHGAPVAVPTPSCLRLMPAPVVGHTEQ